jgi:large subunit ribosomal protein L21
LVFKVLLVGSSDFTVIGRPILNPHFVRVEGIVIEKTLSQTQMDYWYAPKKKKVGARHHRKYFCNSFVRKLIFLFSKCGVIH